jgi:hypothetical protein
VIDRAVIKYSMPELVSDPLLAQRIERILHVGECPVLNPRPVNEVSAAGPARAWHSTPTVLRLLEEAVKILVAVGTRARDFQRFHGRLLDGRVL